MQQRFCFWSLGALTAGLFGLAGAAPATSPAPTGGLFDDPVVARGKGVEIHRSQVEDAYTSLKAKLALRGQTIPERERLLFESQALDGLIVTRLLAKRATPEEQGRGKELAVQAMAEFKTQAGSEDHFRRQLKARGISLEQFEAQLLGEQMAKLVVDRELRSTITITAAQVEAFYQHGTDVVVRLMQQDMDRLAKDPEATLEQLTALKRRLDELQQANLTRLEQPERVRVSHILFATLNRETEEELPPDQKRAKRELAGRILARARAGEDFTKLVQAYSEDRNLKTTGGEYTFARHDPLVPEFKAAAFSLALDQTSDIVTTVFGYHIIRLHERIPARKVEFERVAADIGSALVEQELARQMPAYFDRLKAEAQVEILDPRYRLSSSRVSQPGAPGN